LTAEIWRRDYAYRQRSFKLPENYFPIEEAQIIIAQDFGFSNWEKLMAAIKADFPPQAPLCARHQGPPHRTPAAGCQSPIGMN
jgi:hypothetical protein